MVVFHDAQGAFLCKFVLSMAMGFLPNAPWQRIIDHPWCRIDTGWDGVTACWDPIGTPNLDVF